MSGQVTSVHVQYIKHRFVVSRDRTLDQMKVHTEDITFPVYNDTVSLDLSKGRSASTVGFKLHFS